MENEIIIEQLEKFINSKIDECIQKMKYFKQKNDIPLESKWIGKQLGFAEVLKEIENLKNH